MVTAHWSHPTLADSRGQAPDQDETPPAKGEVKKLRDRLRTYGRDENRPLTEAACQFLSEVVIAPAAVRAQQTGRGIRPRLRPATSR